MIIWLNGTFGVGKTTTARLVTEQTSWRMFDPEHVGYMLAANLKDLEFDDFQELPPWRSLVPAVAAEIHRHTDQSLLAVQTVLVEEYWRELVANFTDSELRVVNVLLDCDSTELRRRIESDDDEAGAREWRIDHIEKFEAAHDWMVEAADVVVDTSTKTPEDVARMVVEGVESHLQS